MRHTLHEGAQVWDVLTMDHTVLSASGIAIFAAQSQSITAF